ncbi:2-dehydropantoate 2-reductase N-terminal domain-containing protein [Streptomyces sp. MZ04]|uniref:ketopantoate reductase family protein n=1 Tax=Streptomyces sp. MZ04 TaxID=2559236 RepID=UPI00107EAB01|nr:2-dehydropantoate 2-reductase N-terminal domain-containing protein [Streptomyces sp. MZ04]TGA91877.1 ketopantoate reductase family protein [Streptomyces sp. MZ04]
MRYIIIGAGAIGGTVGGRLAEAGHDVVLVARGAHHDALRASGLRVSTPDGTRTHRLPVVQHPVDLGELRAGDVLFLAVKTQHCEAAVDAWGGRPVAGGGTAAEVLPLVCAQNGVESERIALRRFRRVYGVCVWLPATHVEPGAVSAAGAPYTGMLHIGRYPTGTDETARLIAADLEQSKIIAPVVPDVMRWKYGKLLSNLANSIEAVTGLITDDAAVELFRRARTEGETVLAAAGIEAVGEQEQKEARGDRIRFEPFDRSERGGGSSWQSLSRGTGTIEADYLNGEIALLGRLHGVPTPVNDALQSVANDFARERRAPGSMPVADLVALVASAGQRGIGPSRRRGNGPGVCATGH